MNDISEITLLYFFVICKDFICMCKYSTVIYYVSGTDEERGIKKWRKLTEDSDGPSSDSRMHIYDLPLIQNCLNKVKCFRYIPFCPSFLRKTTHAHSEDEKNGAPVGMYGIENPAVEIADEYNTKIWTSCQHKTWQKLTWTKRDKKWHEQNLTKNDMKKNY